MDTKILYLDDREREILSKLSYHFEPTLDSTKELDSQNIEKILHKAWNENTEVLHEMGIPKYKIAQMFKNLLSKAEFLTDFIKWQKKGDFFSWQTGLG